MKTKKSHRKLALNKNTIVNLDSAQLGKVGGKVTTLVDRQAFPWLTEFVTDCPSCETCDTCETCNPYGCTEVCTLIITCIC